jgi:hypothetical protein
MNEQMTKKQDESKGKTIGRKNARELTPEEVTLVSGGQKPVAPVHGSAGTCVTCGFDDICY